jgi:hypothetical protein
MNTPNQILEKAYSIKQFVPPTIHFSYKLFLDYFEGPLSPQKVYTGAYMVYGWMPTMLRIKGPTEPIYELALAGRSGNVGVLELQNCATSLNNSLVGTTKLLHFVAPEVYPIWDSRVYRALFGKKPHPYRVEDPHLYLHFLEWAELFELLPGFSDIKARYEEEAGYCVSAKRVVEVILYSLGAKASQPISGLD